MRVTGGVAAAPRWRARAGRYLSGQVCDACKSWPVWLSRDLESRRSAADGMPRRPPESRISIVDGCKSEGYRSALAVGADFRARMALQCSWIIHAILPPLPPMLGDGSISSIQPSRAGPSHRGTTIESYPATSVVPKGLKCCAAPHRPASPSKIPAGCAEV